MTDVKKRKVTARVASQEQIAPGIFDLRLATDLAKDAHPGQFVGLYPAGGELLLPRPISICDVEEDCLRLVYRIAGKGTAYFATLQKGDPLNLIGILGNGFPLTGVKGRRVVLFGGGIGIPPMLYLMRTLSGLGEEAPVKMTAVLGYRDRDTFLTEDFAPYGEVVIATDDGSRGYKGTVTDAVRAQGIEVDILYACGPLPMLRAVKACANGREAYLSLEERMACGVGVCLGCVCETTGIGAHSQVHNARVCTEGPVFAASDVLLS